MKVCVFCNNSPVEKNKEHVIPEWLIELTGNPGRNIEVQSFGNKKNFLSFNHFTFPACKECNTKFKVLEEKAKDIIIKLLEKKKVSSSDFEVIFDWLDKVRIGLWLGSIMYSKNPFGINPKFGISTRSKKDRFLYLLKTSEPSKRLNFSGFCDPLFHLIPCYLGLYINGLCIISGSLDFMFDKHIPLPNFSVLSKKNNSINYVQNNNNNIPIKLPYLGKKATLLLQTYYQFKLNIEVENIFLKKNLESSKVLIVKKKELFLYPEEPSMDWKPLEYEKRDNLMHDYIKKMLNIRNFVLKRGFEVIPEKRSKILYKKLLNEKILH